MKKLILFVTAIAGFSMGCYGQTGAYLYTGSETTITLNPGTYDITAYGAQGGNAYGDGNAGGLGAEMAGQFYFSQVETLTILVGGEGGDGEKVTADGGGGGGGGGSFVVNGNNPLVIAGGGGGATYSDVGGLGGIGHGGGNAGLGSQNDGAGGSSGAGGYGGYGGAGGGGGFYSGGFENPNGDPGSGGGNSFSGGGSGGIGISGGGHGGYGGGGAGGLLSGGGGGGYSGGGGGGNGALELATDFGGGGGSYIDSSASAIITELPGIASPDDSPDGEIFIAAVPEPSPLAMATVGIVSMLVFGCRKFVLLG